MRRELSILDAARVVLSISRTEHTVFEMLLQSSKIYYLPPNNKAHNEPEPSKARKIDLLFLGSGNNKNVQGINGFLEMYRTWKMKPTLAIAGTVSSHVQVDPVGDSSLSVMGYVENLPSLYESVRAAICPVEGTGVNIKLLEALAYGKPEMCSRTPINCVRPVRQH
jgi:glycosyltransferase involved in cell wall biosynthesis